MAANFTEVLIKAPVFGARLLRISFLLPPFWVIKFETKLRRPRSHRQARQRLLHQASSVLQACDVFDAPVNPTTMAWQVVHLQVVPLPATQSLGL